MTAIALVSLVLAAPQEELVFGRRDAEPRPALSYLSSSSGLGSPGLEGGSTEFEFADVNGDGHLDLLSIGDHGSPFVNTLQHGVMTWFGDGLGSWVVSQNGEFGYGGIAVGDVNGDGLLDVAYGMHHNYSSNDFGDQLLEVALGDGSGVAWTPWDDGLATEGETWGMFATDLADVDGDGRLDVGSNSFGCCAGVHVYRNRGDGTWAQTFGFLGGNANADLTFGDLNADGYADLVAANSLGNAWSGAGDGTFTTVDAGLPGTALGRSGFDLGDVNADGREDFAFVLSGAVQVWTLGAGPAWSRIDTGLPASSSLRRVRLADMDGDGAVDLVGVGAGEVAIFRGDGSGAFERAHGFALPAAGTADVLRLADVDHNGRPDVLVMQDETCGLFCSRNRLYVYREASRPRSLRALVVSPAGGELWRGGSVRHVEWTAAVPAGRRARVRIELSLDGSHGPWTALVGSTEDDGTEQLVVPSGLVTSDARVRVVLAAGGELAAATSPRSFRLAP